MSNNKDYNIEQGDRLFQLVAPGHLPILSIVLDNDQELDKTDIIENTDSKPSVRKLSLFDTLDINSTSNNEVKQNGLAIVPTKI